jgi:hypothetical protein
MTTIGGVSGNFRLTKSSYCNAALDFALQRRLLDVSGVSNPTQHPAIPPHPTPLRSVEGGEGARVR